MVWGVLYTAGPAGWSLQGKELRTPSCIGKVVFDSEVSVGKELVGLEVSSSCSQVMHASGKIRAVAAVQCTSGSLPMSCNSALMTIYHKLKTSKQAAYGACLFVLLWVLNDGLPGLSHATEKPQRVRTKIIPAVSAAVSSLSLYSIICRCYTSKLS